MTKLKPKEEYEEGLPEVFQRNDFMEFKRNVLENVTANHYIFYNRHPTRVAIEDCVFKDVTTTEYLFALGPEQHILF